MKAPILATILCLAIAVPPIAAEAASQPDTWLWAWERNEDLSSVTRPIGVAFLAQTLTLHDGLVSTTPRDQSLRLPPRAVLLPVTRIRILKGAALNDRSVHSVADSVIKTLSPGSVGVQIDFDARVSEREFYFDVMTEIKRKLPAGAKLSMTALASWCLYDRWIDMLPEDETVPMFFSMGSDTPSILMYFADGRPICTQCASSIGVSYDEQAIAMIVLNSKAAATRRATYVFSTKPWSRESLNWAVSLPVPRRP
jgi:hypothetical protein